VSSETVTFPAEVLDEIDETVEHVNAQHADTVLFVARHADGRPEGPQRATSAEILGIDPGGIDFEVVDAGGPRAVRFEFPEPTADPVVAQGHVYGLLASARADAGDAEPLTSLERDLAGMDHIRTFPARFLGRRPLSPHLVEVRLGGLEGFAPLGPDTFLYTMVRTDGQGIAADFSIQDLSAQTPGDELVRGAYYTLREWHPESGELVLWVVLHGDGDGPGDGVAGWLERAEPGDPLVLWGPREAYAPAPDATDFLLVADETGLAAVAVIIEGLAPTARAIAILEVDSIDHAPPMPEHPGLTVRWIERGDVEPGRHPGLVEAVAEVDLGYGRGWEAFGGAESRQITKVRKLLRRERGLPAAQVSMTGYWRLENP
jgi:NADPH-dependent ferric siderophore reductase